MPSTGYSWSEVDALPHQLRTEFSWANLHATHRRALERRRTKDSLLAVDHAEDEYECHHSAGLFLAVYGPEGQAPSRQYRRERLGVHRPHGRSEYGLEEKAASRTACLSPE